MAKARLFVWGWLPIALWCVAIVVGPLLAHYDIAFGLLCAGNVVRFHPSNPYRST